MNLAILFHFQLNNCKKNSYYFAKLGPILLPCLVVIIFSKNSNLTSCGCDTSKVFFHEQTNKKTLKSFST